MYFHSDSPGPGQPDGGNRFAVWRILRKCNRHGLAGTEQTRRVCEGRRVHWL